MAPNGGGARAAGALEKKSALVVDRSIRTIFEALVFWKGPCATNLPLGLDLHDFVAQVPFQETRASKTIFWNS
jgi:hypothetical protein